jgi:alpha/beta superfamily hydrolase
MNTKELTFQSQGYMLSGTLEVPTGSGSFPCVVMLVGSGQVDRDENHPKMITNTFSQIANYLSAQGFASFRFDKRGVGKSQGNYNASGFYDNRDDGIAALELVREQPEIDPTKIFVLGHSEGALLATSIAKIRWAPLKTLSLSLPTLLSHYCVMTNVAKK